MADSELLSMPKLAKAVLELGPEFYDAVRPARFPECRLRYWNDPLVGEMGWKEKFKSADEKARRFQRFEAFPESLPEPLALRYHGHQFRHYNPDLGDGRGFLYAQAEWKNKLWDFGTKGSGQTPYSRSGDGRLTLKGAFREALATEMLESLGVNTSRTFCFFETGEQLERGDEPSPTRSAVLTRFSHSHVRLGSFQRLAFLGQGREIEILARYTARHLLKEIDADLETELLLPRLLRNVSHRLAHLTAQWMLAGFVHGVLNTDNLNVTGESFDYGPYRFLPYYDPNFTAAYFDRTGLYRYGAQPASVFWAIERFAESLAVRLPELPIAECLNDFGDVFSDSINRLFCHRLNIKMKSLEETTELIRFFFHFQEAQETGFEQTFFDLFRKEGTPNRKRSPQKNSYDSEEGKALLRALEKFETESDARARHPALENEKPVTLLIDEIESLWKPIAETDDWDPFNKKLEEIRSLRALFFMKSVTPDYFVASTGFPRPFEA